MERGRLKSVPISMEEEDTFWK